MKKIYLLFSIVLFVVACQKEEVPVINEIPKKLSMFAEKIPFSALPLEIQSLLTGKSFAGKQKEGKDKILFGSPRTEIPAIKNKNRNGQFSYTIALKNLEEGSTNSPYFDNLVINELKESRQKLTVLRYKPNPEWYHSAEKDIGNFSGTIEFYTVKGDFLGRLILLKGKGVEKPEQNKGYSTTCTYTLKETWCFGGTESGDSYSCSYTFEETCTSSYSYEDTDSGDSGGSNYDNDSGDGESGHVTTTPIVEEEEAIKVDDSELEGKEKCLNDLLNQKGDSYIQNLLNNFRGNSEFDIKIGSKENIWNPEKQKYVNGRTYGPVNNLIRIDISSLAASNGSALWVVRTLLHEYIHADIFRKLNTQLITNDIIDFKTTFEQYERDHHETMGALYVTSMRDALKSFHQHILIDDYNAYLNWYGAPTDDFYEALAWQGLKDNDIKAYNELSNEKKQSIENEEQKLGILKKDCPQN